MAVAGLLFAFIYFVERHTASMTSTEVAAPRLLSIKPEEITKIQLERVLDATNKVLTWLEKTNQSWNLTFPLFYPAQQLGIEDLLQALAHVTSETYITPQELAATHRSIAEYGLDVPAATLTLYRGAARTAVLFGSKTPVGDNVYVQLLTSPGIYVVRGDIFDRLPHSPNDWRDPYLINIAGLSLDRMEVRAAGQGFALQETNKSFYLSKPQMMRASRPRVEALLQKLQLVRVANFISDDPRVELEPLGLQQPEAELAFGYGSNDVVVVQFGKSPTNDPSLVYARCLSHMNIVLVPKTILDAILTPHTELRDRHLFSFSPTELDRIEVIGPEKFTVLRQTNGWLVTEPQAAVADPEVMGDLLQDLDRLEGKVEKDVVTDFGSYVLNQPARQYILRGSVTNTDGTITNRILSQLDIGGVQQDRIFARRSDENSVYSLSRADFDHLPAAAWQLRDRRVWSFTTNQVSHVSVRQHGYIRQWDRSPTGQWRFAPGSQGILDDRQFSLEETMHQLGELRAAIWVARGEENRAIYGFTDEGYKMIIDLKNGEKTNSLSLEFGGFAPSSKHHYALAAVDGQSWIFEFPLALSFQVLRDFSNPPPRTAAATPPQ